jgi:phosphoribosylaminoimidazole-succinocarboxamide synthase
MKGVTLYESDVSEYPLRRGKVRDIYDLGDTLVIVATDRISAFDWVLPTPIPDKGRVLTALTRFWLQHLRLPNHLISIDLSEMPRIFSSRPDLFEGRTMLVRKTRVVPAECVVRGYLAGSGWKEYRIHGTICGQPLPPGLLEGERLPEPIFTPSTKAEQGHDLNISLAEFETLVGAQTGRDLMERSVSCYQRAADVARTRGLIIADTKFEWGHTSKGELILVDEVLTPDSSRFWPADRYRPGHAPPSFDKQYVRDWLEASGWDKNSRPPKLPPEVVSKTREKYLEAHKRLTGEDLL